MRKLTAKQHRRLDAAAEQYPGVRVIGWHENGRGPILIHNGKRRYVNREGRMVALHADPMGQAE